MTIKEQAERLHKTVEIFILSCIDSNGYPLTKAVVPGKHREALNELYFATNTSSKFVDAIIKNRKSSVYFFRQDDTAWEGCFLKGSMEIVTDMNIKEKYWLEDYREAYPLSVFTDPDYCLIRFIPSSGRFYNSYSVEDFEV
ncbi:MAG: pyridoxamine 5'-phosphate oxidase family protein [Defluviitaleaceae bacterium]|nr:pyridoxamine 5'-phosphate oxidase family protein [Defluviitaleaceae bacterium]